MEAVGVCMNDDDLEGLYVGKDASKRKGVPKEDVSWGSVCWEKGKSCKKTSSVVSKTGLDIYRK